MTTLRALLILLACLFCVAQVRSTNWVLEQPCDRNNNTANYGVFQSGYCSSRGGTVERESVCDEKNDLWITSTCVGNDQCTSQCQVSNSIPTNECYQGTYSACSATSASLIPLGFDGVVVSVYNTPDCASGPNAMYVVENSQCTNITPPGTFFNSLQYTCSQDGSQATLSVYAPNGCGGTAYTQTVPTNVCTTGILSKPTIVSCLKKSL